MEDKIKKWINKNGYPLELKVAKTFAKAGFNVAQSISFEDPVSGKSRETDIIAHITKSINDVWINLTFVIECKLSTEKPWVGFYNNHSSNFSSNHFPIMTTRNGHFLLEKINKNSKFKSNLLFPNKKKMGYSIVRAFNDNGKDMAFSAIQSVLSATEYLVEKSNKSNKKFLNIYFPVVVIEGKLYKAEIDFEDNIQVQKIEEIKISTVKSFAEQNSTYVSICEFKELNKISKKLMNDCKLIFDNYDPELKEITDKHPINLVNIASMIA